MVYQLKVIKRKDEEVRKFHRKRELLTEFRGLFESSRSQKLRPGRPRFIDDFPLIPGTGIEKKIFNKLRDFQIRFRYQVLFADLIGQSLQYNYRPDFALPDLKIIILVHGLYWHSMPSRIEKDAFAIAFYEFFGWKTLVWWDFEIEQNIDALLSRDLPELLTQDRPYGYIPYEGPDKIEHEGMKKMQASSLAKRRRIIRIQKGKDIYASRIKKMYQRK